MGTFVGTFVGMCVGHTLGISGASQNVANKSSLVCVKRENMHVGSPSDTWNPCGKGKLGYLHYIIMRGEVELHILELTSVFHHLPSVGTK